MISIAMLEQPFVSGCLGFQVIDVRMFFVWTQGNLELVLFLFVSSMFLG